MPGMPYEDVLAMLAWAGDHGRTVRIVTDGPGEVVGVPTSLDDHVTAHEVYLRPAGVDDVEISISLGAIRSVELV
jgi:hypothetical protein